MSLLLSSPGQWRRPCRGPCRSLVWATRPSNPWDGTLRRGATLLYLCREDADGLRADACSERSAKPDAGKLGFNRLNLAYVKSDFWRTGKGAAGRASRTPAEGAPDLALLRVRLGSDRRDDAGRCLPHLPRSCPFSCRVRRASILLARAAT